MCECGVVPGALGVDVKKGADRRLPFNPLFFIQTLLKLRLDKPPTATSFSSSESQP